MEKQQKAFKGIMNYKCPEFFSPALVFIISGITWFLSFYMIFSLLIYWFYHFFALHTLKPDQTVYASTDSVLLSNVFNSIILCSIVALGLLTLFKQTISCFILYMSSFAFFFFGYGFGYNVTFLSKEEGLGYLIYCLFNIISFIAFMLLATYSLMFYLKSIGYFKYHLNDVPMEDIIHEVKLRTDLAKMSFNATMIKWGLHRISKRILFKPSDYYFTNMTSEKEDSGVIKNKFSSSDDSIMNKSMNTNGRNTTFDTAEHSYIKLDNDEK